MKGLARLTTASGARKRPGAGLALALALLTALFQPGAAFTQEDVGSLSLEQVLAHHYQARGGEAAWSQAKGLLLEGSFTSFSIPGPAKLWMAPGGPRNGRARFEHTLNGKPAVAGSDGETAWYAMHPFVDLPAPQLMGQVDADDFTEISSWPNPLLAAAKEGRPMELLGLQELDGEQVMAVVIDKGEAQEQTWYLHPETWLEVASDRLGSDFNRPTPQRTFFSDFRQVGDLVVPHRVESEFRTRYRDLELSSGQVLSSVDDALFAVPTPKGMDSLGYLSGEWQVKLEGPPFPGGPMLNAELNTQMQTRQRGGVIEEQAAFRDHLGFPRELLRLWTYDPHQETYRLVQSMDDTRHANVLQGQRDEEGKLVLDNVGTNTTWSMDDKTYHDRVILHPEKEGGFVLEHETSEDGGANWTLSARWTYSRPGSEADTSASEASGSETATER